MMTRIHVRALMFGVVVLGGCGPSPFQGAQVRVRTTTAAFEHPVPSADALAPRSSKSAREASPLAQACKSGTSKACNELGDRLVLKHAHAEAQQWYLISCERMRSAMLPTATRLLQLGQELKQVDGAKNYAEYETAAAQKRTAALKSDASEIRARLRGCLDTGETMKVDGELRQSLSYYDAVCEFSVLVEAAGEALLDLESMTENGCAASQAARAELPAQTPFSPRLFADLVQQQHQPVAAKQNTAQSEEGMVFSEGDL